MYEVPAKRQSPPDVAFFRRLSIIVILIVIGGFGAWSAVARIDGAVIANGQVVVESSRKTIQHLEGGVIDKIVAREGQFVEAGDLLVKLDDTTQRAILQSNDAQLSELYARRARLVAEREELGAIQEPVGLPVVLAQSVFAANLEGQRQLFAAKQASQQTKVSLLEERIVQHSERMSGIKAQIDSLKDQRTLIVDELEGVRELYAQGFAPKTRLRALEREEKRLSGEQGALDASVAEAKSVIAESRLEIIHLKEVRREGAIKELRDVEVSIADLEERRVSAADELARTEIRAPHSGHVLSLKIHTIGGVIRPGEPLMDIVPNGDRLRVAAQVAPHDIDKVEKGQETLIRFSGFGTRYTPEVNGIVVNVSADSMVDDISGKPYFLVEIELPEASSSLHTFQDQPLSPGMPAETYIRTGSKPAITYFIKPLTDAIARSMREE